MKKRTKKYRPREVTADPISWAIAGVHTLPVESQASIMEPIDDAFLLLKKGVARREDWNVVGQALNLAEAFGGMQIGPNLLPAIMAGQSALHRIALRMLETGSSTCYGAELATIEEALMMYRVQLKVCTQAELSRAFQRLKNLHRCGAMQDVARLYEQMDAAG